VLTSRFCDKYASECISIEMVLTEGPLVHGGWRALTGLPSQNKSFQTLYPTVRGLAQLDRLKAFRVADAVFCGGLAEKSAN